MKCEPPHVALTEFGKSEERTNDVEGLQVDPACRIIGFANLDDAIHRLC